MASEGKRTFPHSGTSGKLLQLLSLKRPKKTTNWNKCLICQSTNSTETLRQASVDGITTFKEACSQRLDDVFEPLSSDIEHMSTMQVLWHGKCYQSYTSKQNVLFVKSTSPTSTQRLHTMVHSVKVILMFLHQGLLDLESYLRIGPFAFSVRKKAQEL